jgi:uncharacterized protein YbgA (DUF1722 family)
MITMLEAKDVVVKLLMETPHKTEAINQVLHTEELEEEEKDLLIKLIDQYPKEMLP